MMSSPSSAISKGSPPSAPKTTRSSTWYCRLPEEVMALVLDILFEEGHLATIGAIQQTSSSLYTAATPYLYRHIQLDLPNAVRLLGLFNAFPLDDNMRFFNPVPNRHLIDMHVADRLRMFLSYTEALTLTIWAQEFVGSPNWRAGPKRCHDLVVGLSAFGAPTLWPKLERCDVKMGEVVDHWNPLLIQPEEYEPIFDALFAKMLPRHMSIRFPSLDDFNGEEHLGSWVTCQKTLSADHITYIDYEPSTLGLPHASSTLTVCFNTNQYIPLTEVGLYIRVILQHRYALCDIHQLKIVGLLVTLQLPNDMNNHNTENALHVFDRIGHDITGLMSHRLQIGNLEDLDISIQPDTSPEGEAAAHWRTYKQPKAVSP